MELRTYWAIIWRRLWLVALVFIVVALYVGYQYYHLRKTPGALTAYHSNVTIEIALQSTNNQDTSYADNLTISTDLADALANGPILTSNEFDSDVSQQIGKDTNEIAQRFGANADLGNWQDSGAIGGALSAVALHNLVTVSVTWATPAGAWAIANAVGEVSANHIGNYINYVIGQNATGTSGKSEPAVSAQVISSATSPASGPGSASNKLTLLVLLLLVGLIIGIALAFLADYLDDRLHTKDEVGQLLHLPIYGEIPRPPAIGKSEPTRRSSSPVA